MPSLPLRERSRITGEYENSVWRELNLDIAVRHVIGGNLTEWAENLGLVDFISQAFTEAGIL
ncbi:hypothetical protein [Calothrix sp. PCC 6303]|uniref:hypothetical protein n=1 Tax=Calothrix sp. PCC 6303 TaxID=1170562 RepID=UPI00031637C8|nr:hypothetical protein [Calothrix sp. PCC 6303]